MKLLSTGLLRIATLGLFSVAVALPSLADVVEVGPLKDNTLYEQPLGSLSNGSGQHIFTGLTASSAIRRSLLAFDIAAAVPAGAKITSVSLTLNMSMTISGDEPVALHRLVSDWGESTSDANGQEGGGAPAEDGDATWIHTFSPGSNWSNVGGDFVRTASDTQLVGGDDEYTWISAAMVSDVQSWLDNPAENFGWIVIGNESASATAKRFDSRENPDESVRPVLTIEFSQADVPASSNLGVALLAALTLLFGSAFLIRRGMIAER